MRRTRLLIAAAGLALVVSQAHLFAAPQLASYFTFQGYLTDSGRPANGLYDFQFKLYDAATGGSQVAVTNVMDDVQVTDGVFDVMLLFERAFDGQNLWLQIEVRPGASSGPYVVLDPREPITGVPYAVYALTAAYAEDANRLDGYHASHFVATSADYGRSGVAANLYEGNTPLSDKYVKKTGDTMSGTLTIDSASGYGLHATSGFTYPVHAEFTGGSYGSGLLGKNTGGVGDGVQGISDGRAGVWGRGSGTSSAGVYGLAEGANGVGVRGEANSSASGTNYGGYFTAAGPNGRGVYAEATGASGRGVEATGSAYGGKFTSTNDYSVAVHGYCNVTNGGRGVKGEAFGEGGFGVEGRAYGANGRGVYGYASGANRYGVYGWNTASGGYAGYFQGDVRVNGNLMIYSGSAKILELGSGLDYAEGFDVSEKDKIAPGTVLVIDPDNPGKLKVSSKPYDSKVAGIVAGAKGIRSGVRLGTGQFDHDVALAGRVYCNVDATYGAVEPGDLLTTSPTPGYAMKVTDRRKAAGAILGKAMERLEQGKKGQILVLVTLQ